MQPMPAVIMSYFVIWTRTGLNGLPRAITKLATQILAVHRESTETCCPIRLMVRRLVGVTAHVLFCATSAPLPTHGLE
jgi:hypothetical protein